MDHLFLKLMVQSLIYCGGLMAILVLAWTIYFWKIRPREDWKKEIPMRRDEYRGGALDD